MFLDLFAIQHVTFSNELNRENEKSLWGLLKDAMMVAILAQNEDRDLLFLNHIKFNLKFHLETLPKHLGII